MILYFDMLCFETRMTTFIKTKFKKFNGQKNIDIIEYANITE